MCGNKNKRLSICRKQTESLKFLQFQKPIRSVYTVPMQPVFIVLNTFFDSLWSPKKNRFSSASPYLVKCCIEFYLGGHPYRHKIKSYHDQLNFVRYLNFSLKRGYSPLTIFFKPHTILSGIQQRLCLFRLKNQVLLLHHLLFHT